MPEATRRHYPRWAQFVIAFIVILPLLVVAQWVYDTYFFVPGNGAPGIPLPTVRDTEVALRPLLVAPLEVIPVIIRGDDLKLDSRVRCIEAGEYDDFWFGLAQAMSQFKGQDLHLGPLYDKQGVTTDEINTTEAQLQEGLCTSAGEALDWTSSFSLVELAPGTVITTTLRADAGTGTSSGKAERSYVVWKDGKLYENTRD